MEFNAAAGALPGLTSDLVLLRQLLELRVRILVIAHHHLRERFHVRVLRPLQRHIGERYLCFSSRRSRVLALDTGERAAASFGRHQSNRCDLATQTDARDEPCTSANQGSG